MPQGNIKKLKADKGYGFITPESGKDDIFFHCSAVVGMPFDDLKEGDAVSFEVEDGKDKRKRAANVRRV